MAGIGTLSANKKKALRALLECSTVRAAARQASLGERTVHRYLRDPAFKCELRELQDETLAAAAAALSGLAGTAVQKLSDLLDDKDASKSVQVRAALGILNEARKVTELDNLADRVSALENQLEAGR